MWALWGWWSVCILVAQMIDARLPCQAVWNWLKYYSAPLSSPSTQPSCGCKGGVEKWAEDVISFVERTPKAPQPAEKESSARAWGPMGPGGVEKRDTTDTTALALQRDLGISSVLVLQLETIRQCRYPTLTPHQFTSASTDLSWHRGATWV